MTQVNHVDALRAKHAELEAKIEQENARPLPDDMVINHLKRQKLRIKDELAQLSK